ncbi:hypothetical protein SAMN06265218_11015 [Fodinibius sediminis]|uniref:DUF3052 domain-containing protein n=2 Tax=Fodinibius sediminis TaxID=1214077 RepID=A0A521DGJ9_9BACT|nr:hypothetical protein SAMN06265218_11015 [Fodinibius sediminis]
MGLFNAPDNVLDLTGELPEDVAVIEELQGRQVDIILGFIENRNMLETHLPVLRRALDDEGALWVAYYKGSASIDTDINRDSIHDYAKSIDLKGVAMVSIDENWSGFRFKKV